MRIGELAKAAGVGVETIRYYERCGLLPAPARGAGGYRSYGAQDLSRVRFIRRAKTLGFGLDEIGELLALREDEATPCAEVARRAHDKLADLGRRIEQLAAIQHALARLAAACRRGDRSSACALLDYLTDEGTAHG